MKLTRILAIVSTVVASTFYMYVDAPGTPIDKNYVDAGKILFGKDEVDYFFLTSNADDANPSFSSGGTFGVLYHYGTKEVGVNDYLLSLWDTTYTPWWAVYDINSYQMYACMGQDTKLPQSVYVLYGYPKDRVPSTGGNDGRSPIVESSSEPNLPIEIAGPTDTHRGGEGEIVRPTDVIDNGPTNVEEPIETVNQEVPIPVETEGEAVVTPEILVSGNDLHRRQTADEMLISFPVDTAQCIPVALRTTDNISGVKPKCTETTCGETPVPSCLTVCKPCSFEACVDVCEEITICEDPPLPSPDPNIPSPDPNSLSPNPHTPYCPECTVVLPGCPTCVKTVTDWVITCPTETTITITTCPQVDVCSPHTLVLSPGIHTVTGKAVVPATSGSFTVVLTRSGTVTKVPSVTGAGASASPSGSRVSGSSLTGFNGGLLVAPLLNTALGTMMLLLMLW